MQEAPAVADVPPSGSAGVGFGDRLADRVAVRRSQVVVGLDPDPGRLWPRAVELAGGDGAPAAERAARAVAAHCSLVIEATGEYCVAVKTQLACFERLGAAGWAALAEVVACAHEHGLLVIADAKRGDIDLSAAAYGQAFFGETPTPFGPVEGLGADALTVNPLMGLDSLRPLVDAARRRSAGLFLLVATSNPGAADVQDLALAGAGTVSDRLAEMVAALGEGGLGSSGLTDIGAVAGATVPERLSALRAMMPQAVFLLPGVGAQGGQVQQLAPAFAPGRAGGLIAASRGIVFAHEPGGGDPAMCAAAAAQRLREQAWELVS